MTDGDTAVDERIRTPSALPSSHAAVRNLVTPSVASQAPTARRGQSSIASIPSSASSAMR